MSRFDFGGVALHMVAKGLANEMHPGVKSTMKALSPTASPAV
jgi:hypothetical protein